MWQLCAVVGCILNWTGLALCDGDAGGGGAGGGGRVCYTILHLLPSLGHVSPVSEWRRVWVGTAGLCFY